MLKVGLREIKNNLGIYVRKVIKGERIIVTERNQEVAFLFPTVRIRPKGSC